MIEKTSDEERDRRRAICRECPYVRLLGRHQFMQCTKCGCVLALLIRAKRATCPASKW